MKDTTSVVSGILDNATNKPVEIYDIYLDDSTLHFTAFDRNLDFYDPDGSATTYTALGISRDTIKTTVDTKVDSVSIKLDNVNRAMSSYVASNEFRGRSIVVRKIFADISGSWTQNDDVYMFKGIMNRPSLGEGVMEMECVSRAGTFEYECPRRGYGISCPWKFAASGCTDGDMSTSQLLNTFSGTADAGCTATVILDSALPQIDDYYNYGTVDFTSGANNGDSRIVIDSASGTSFTVGYELDAAPAAGDTFELHRGCDKNVATCSGIGNEIAFGGFFTIPQEMKIQQV